MVDEISNQCSVDQNSNSYHIIRKEEDQNDNQTSFIKMCDDNEPKNDLIKLPSFQMNEYNEKSNKEQLLMSGFNQECSLLQPSSFPILHKESLRNSSLNFDIIPHSIINLNKEALSYSHDVDFSMFQNLKFLLI